MQEGPIWAISFSANLVIIIKGKFLKKLWCCVGGIFYPKMEILKWKFYPKMPRTLC